MTKIHKTKHYATCIITTTILIGCGLKSNQDTEHGPDKKQESLGRGSSLCSKENSKEFFVVGNQLVDCENKREKVPNQMNLDGCERSENNGIDLYICRIPNDEKTEKLAENFGPEACGLETTETGAIEWCGDDSFSFSHGFQGEKGEKGEKGPKGPRGEKGPKGESGEKGPRGKSGTETGDLGDRGPQGEKGDRGEAGERGVQGIQGPPGDRGPEGDRGPTGDRGSKGATGHQVGEMGPIGVPGIRGKIGEVGRCYCRH